MFIELKRKINGSICEVLEIDASDIRIITEENRKINLNSLLSNLIEIHDLYNRIPHKNKITNPGIFPPEIKNL